MRQLIAALFAFTLGGEALAQCVKQTHPPVDVVAYYQPAAGLMGDDLKTLLTERSITIGSAPGTGAAKAIGLVPNSARDAPQGAIAPGVLTSIIATSPWRASSSTKSPVTPA